MPVVNGISVAVSSADLLGEGPSWDDRTEQLTWVDIKGRKVRAWSPGRHAVVDVDVPNEPSLALPRLRGGRVVAQVDHLAVTENDDSPLRPICEIDAGNPHTRLNDGCCDTQGRLWVGTYSTRGAPEAGLYVVTADGTVRQVLDGMVASNGIEWSPTGDVLHVADTGRCRVDSYVVPDAPKGGEPRLVPCGTVLAEDGSRGRPDGLTVDREGAIWVAMWGGGHLRRYSPDGALAAEVPLPVTYPTAVALGGRDLRTIFVTTSRHHLTDPTLEPHAGSVLSLASDVGGLSTRRFAG
jgi:sugar lactone lactonase YvrE